MARLLFEIWEDPDHRNFEMGQVSASGDDLRRRIAPNSILLDRYYASSDFEAFQLNYDWHGWGAWTKPGWPEEFFTDEEEAEQTRYLSTRDI